MLDGHGFRVEVEEAGNEGAHHEAGSLEGLVHGRRLVDAPHDRLEVGDGERPRVDAAVPSGDVEGMVGVGVPRPPARAPAPNR